jgi:hypothetical protein
MLNGRDTVAYLLPVISDPDEIQGLPELLLKQPGQV